MLINHTMLMVKIEHVLSMWSKKSKPWSRYIFHASVIYSLQIQNFYYTIKYPHLLKWFPLHVPHLNQNNLKLRSYFLKLWEHACYIHVCNSIFTHHSTKLTAFSTEQLQNVARFGHPFSLGPFHFRDVKIFCQGIHVSKSTSLSLCGSAPFFPTICSSSGFHLLFKCYFCHIFPANKPRC